MLAPVETYIKRAQADNFKEELSFNSYHCIEAIAMSRRIVIMWNKDEALVIPVFESKQALYLSILVNSLSIKLLISAIYACTRFQELVALWDDLVFVCWEVSEP